MKSNIERVIENIEQTGSGQMPSTDPVEPLCVSCGGDLRWTGVGKLLGPLERFYTCSSACGREHGCCLSCTAPTSARDVDRCDECTMQGAGL